MRLVEDKGIVSTSFQQIQLYGNLCYMKSNTDESSIVKEKLDKAISTLRDTMSSMDTLCKQTDKQQLITSFETWKTKVLAFCDYAQKISDAAKSNDPDQVLEPANGIKANKTPADEAQTAYEKVFSDNMSAISDGSSAQISGMTRLDIILLFAVIIIFLIIIIVIVNTVIKPAKNSRRILNQIVDSMKNNEGDLTIRIPVTTSDEVGQLSDGINSFTDTLQKLMVQLKAQADSLMASVKNVTDKLSVSNDSATSISATMEEMSASMEEISATISQVVTNSDNVLLDAGRMNSNVDSGMTLVKDIKSRASGMLHTTEEGKNTTGTTIIEIKEKLDEALKESQNVEKINDLIDDILAITQQTNLLSLNASIEAARAGEAVKKLSANAESMLKFVDEKVLKDYDDFLNVVKQYDTDADTMKDLFTDFAGSTTDINEKIGTMTTSISDISKAVEESAKGVTDVAQTTVVLVTSMNDIHEEMSNSIDISSRLNEEVQKFKKI